MPFVGDFINAVWESINQLFVTPMNTWEWQQWLLASFLLSLFLWCCGCLSFRCSSCWRTRRAGGGVGGGGRYGGWRGRRRKYDNPFDDDERHPTDYYRSYRIMPSSTATEHHQHPPISTA